MFKRVYIPVFSVTIIISAALLFVIQPMFAKMVLPMLGGSPQVWNTAMLFFQATLLAGYAYAHLLARFLPFRWQMALHLSMLAIFATVLPFGIPPGMEPQNASNPALWQLALMLGVIGGPFFVLAASAPLLQHWFTRTDHKDAGNPYFLYGASNLGSVGALLSYPVLIEPFMTLELQAEFWMVAYVILGLCFAMSGITVWHSSKKTAASKTKSHKNPNIKITWQQRFIWLGLAFLPSSLMLGVTTYITTDIAAVPLFWIMPLTIYISTFILVFARREIFSMKTIMMGHAVTLIAIIILVSSNQDLNTFLVVFTHLAALFFAAMVCHKQLALLKPPPQSLTEFYLIMSLGGALGGLFNALVAPTVFIIPLEYALVLGATVLARLGHEALSKAKSEPLQKLESYAFIFSLTAIALHIFLKFFALGWLWLWAYLVLPLLALNLFCLSDARWKFASVVTMLLILAPPGYRWENSIEKQIHQDRNFFGVLRIMDKHDEGVRFLLHGTTNHGSQALNPEHKLIRIGYYHKRSPLQDVINFWDKKDSAEQNFAVLGLGIGIMACYPKDGRHMDFFEIDPDVIKIAENPEFFTYLRDCGTPYNIILGDGRLTIQNRPDSHYDVITLDAFSSDSIPVHLMTLDAFKMYHTKLRQDGVIIAHISNRYLNLEPIIGRIAKEMGMTAMALFKHKETEIGDTGLITYPSHYVVLTQNPDLELDLRLKGWRYVEPADKTPLWTDNFSNIISALRM